MKTLESKAQHTPGPWRINPHIGNKSDLGITAYGAPCIITIMHGAKLNEWPTIAHANARLIAAAPELLAALKELTEYADKMMDEILKVHMDGWNWGRLPMQTARAAIGKATTTAN